MYNIENIIKTAAELMTEARLILFITGAGISADSGLPTYRGLGGLYNDTSTEDGYAIEDALSAEVMSIRPDITWKYLWQIGSACIKAEPNSAHKIITLIQRLKPDTWVLTQNIDGLHGAAGNRNLIEMHGNAFRLCCTKCGDRTNAKDIIYASQGNVILPPICSKCGGMIRPEVVLFGEMLPERALASYYEILARRPDLVISIGTSGMFPYITGPVYEAKRRHASTIEINPAESAISGIVDCHVRLGAAKAMEMIWEKGLRDWEHRDKT